MIFQHIKNINTKDFDLFGPVSQVKILPAQFNKNNFSFKQKETLLKFNQEDCIIEIDTQGSRSTYTYDEKNNLKLYQKIDFDPYDNIYLTKEVSYKSNSFIEKYKGITDAIYTYSFFANAYFISEEINYLRGAEFNEHYKYYKIKNHHNVYSLVEHLNMYNNYEVKEFFWLDSSKKVFKRFLLKGCGIPSDSVSDNIINVIRSYFYEYFENDNLKSITLIEKDKSTFTEYNIDGQLVLMEIRDNQKNIIKSEKYEYNKNKLLAEYHIDKHNGDYSLTYKYETDKHNNWIKKIFSINGSEVGFVQRDIQYKKNQ